MLECVYFNQRHQSNPINSLALVPAITSLFTNQSSGIFSPEIFSLSDNNKQKNENLLQDKKKFNIFPM